MATGPDDEPASGAPSRRRRILSGAGSSSKAGRPGVRLDLEGVRALAVLGVVVYHLRATWLPGGFAGVDVFFVLSGFFITGLLVREAQRSGRVDLLAFWGRRARRLLPASALVLVVTLLASAIVSDSLDGARFAHDARYVALFAVNWSLARQGTDYLQDTDPSPFQHYWSLGVEEQFYVVWPVVVLLVALALRRWLGSTRSVLFAVVGVASVLSFAIAYRQTTTLQPYAYFATYSRVWQLGVGALLALAAPWLARLSLPVRSLCRIAGVALVIGFYAFAPIGVVYPGSAALIPVAGVALIVLAGLPRTGGAPVAAPTDPVWRGLASRPGQALGRYSYSWYLWHWPPLVLLPLYLDRPLGARGVILVGVGSLAVAVVSYHLVENPLRASRWLSWRRGGRSLALGAAIVALGLGAAQASTAYAHYEQRHSTVTASSGQQLVPQPAVAAAEVPRPTADGCEVGLSSLDSQKECRYRPDTGHGDVILVGDSHAVQWFAAVDKLATREHWGLRVWARASCPLAGIDKLGSPDQTRGCRDWHADIMKRLVRARPSLVIVTGFASRVNSLRDPSTGKTVAGAAARAVYERGLAKNLGVLRAVGIPVLMIRDNPSYTESGPKCALQNGKDLAKCSSTRSAALRADSDAEAARATPGVRLVDFSSHYCTVSRCSQIVGRIMAYRDTNHLTNEMVLSLEPELAKAALRTIVVR